MEDQRPQHRLRSYLIAAFVPLSCLPVLALAVLTYVFVGRAIDQEISRRAGPELAALSRNLDTLETKLGKQLTTLAREEELKGAITAANPRLTRSLAEIWLNASAFESLRIYAADGTPAVTITRTAGAPDILEGWSPPTRERKPANATEPPSRRPSAALVGANFRGPLGLSDSLRTALRDEDYWSVKEVNDRSRSLRYAAFKEVVGPGHEPLAYLEGDLAIEDAKLTELAKFQGLDITLLAPDLRVLAASTPELGAQIPAALRGLRTVKLAPDLRDIKREITLHNEASEFFFAPLQNEGNEPVAWIGVGLSKADQVLFRNQILIWIVALALVMAAAVTALTFAISARITRPLTDLVAAAEAMRAGEWVQPVHAGSKNEVGYLVRRFNDMALSVQSAKSTLETKLQELAQAHDELTQAQGQLVQSAKMSSLGQLVAGVAHELNNPIAFIYSNMSQMRQYLKSIERVDGLLRELKPELNATSQRHLETALQEIEWDYVRGDMDEIVKSCIDGSIRVKDIVLGLRNFSRLDQGQIADTDLHAALRDTVKLLGSQIRNRIEIHWDLGEDGHAQANLSQINQVFMNLLANAAQSIAGKGDVWVGSSVDSSDDALVITIRDSGQGIAPEHIDRIFDPFFTTKKVGDGTGLGLSIVYGIVQRHRGVISVTSVVAPTSEHGTSFTLRLPRRAGVSVPSSGERRAS